MKKTILLTILALCLCFISCSMDLFDTKSCHSLQLSQTSISADISTGEVYTVTAKTYDKKGELRNSTDMSWSFSPADSVQIIAKTKDSISFSVQKPGKIVLSGYDTSNSGIVAQCIINATGNCEEVQLVPNSITINQKERFKLQARMYPEGATYKRAVWSSENDEIATVEMISDTEATLIGGIPGETTITVVVTNSDNSTVQASCTVKVSETELLETSPRYMSISESYLALQPGGSSQEISVTVYDAYNQPYTQGTISWQSTDTSVLSVEGFGTQATLIPNKAGYCQVTATLVNYPEYDSSSPISASCTISVGNALADIIISPYEPPVKMMSKSVVDTEEPQSSSSLPIGKTVYFQASYLPAESSDKGVIWSTTDDCIEISSDGEIVAVTAKSTGTANLIASSSVNDEIASYVTISVYDPSVEPDWTISSIELDPVATTLEAGQSGQITATVLNHYGNPVEADVIWSSDNSAVMLEDVTSSTISFTTSGSVSKNEIATITAKVLTSPFVTAEAQVLVYPKGKEPGNEVGALHISKTGIVMAVDKDMDLSLSYLPSSTSQKGAQWQTSSDCISIDGSSSGAKITAKQEGTATITATSTSNPDLTAKSMIKVISNEEIAGKPAAIEVSADIVELEVGNAQRVTATVRMLDGTTSDLHMTWKANGENIELYQEEENSAEIRALSAGEATVDITLNDYPDIHSQIKVWVSDGDIIPGVKLQRILPSSSSIRLKSGSTSHISITHLPESTADRDVDWETSSASVASVVGDNEGADIKAITPGKATITVKSRTNPSVKAEISVDVIGEIPETVRSIAFDFESTSISIDPPYPDGEIIPIQVHSYNQTGDEVADTYIWTLEQSGDVISGHKDASAEGLYYIGVNNAGEATLKVQSRNNPSIFATLRITVTGAIEGISFSSNRVVLSKNSNATITASLHPEGTVDTQLKWTASENLQYTVDPLDPLSVTVKSEKPGTYTLRAESSVNSNVYAICTVVVLDEELPAETFPESIELSSDTLTLSPSSKTAILSATVYGSNHTIYPRGVTWRIENEEIAELTTEDEFRVSIEAKKAGTTRIVASSKVDSSVVAACILSVTGKITSIVPEQTHLQIIKGTNQEVAVSLQPTDTIETELIWEVEGFEEGSVPEEGATPIVSLRPTNLTCIIDGLEIGQTRIFVRSAARPEEVYAIIAVDVINAPLVNATITISPSIIELSPDSERTSVKATVKVSGDDVINEEVEWTIEPANLALKTPGGPNEILISPNGISAEGTIYARLPSYDYIEPGKARLFVGGALKGLVPVGKQSIAVNVGDTAEISVEYNPENTTEKGIIWTTSNSNVATVSGGSSPDAIVTGRATGTATITATSVAHQDISVEFTVVVKSIISEIAYTDQNGNQGLTFYTSTTEPLTLVCSIAPETAAQRKIIYSPTSTNFTMASIMPVNDTINDIVFTPDPGAAGTSSFDLKDSITGRVVGTLEINTYFDGLSINSNRHVFKKGDTFLLEISSESGPVSSDQLIFTSSDSGVVSVDRNGNVRAVAPGYAVITTKVSGSAELKTEFYVNVDIPESFERALRECGYLDYDGDTILPSDFENITELDLTDTPSDLSVDLSKLGTDIFPKLEVLKIDGLSLVNSRLSLSGTRIKELYASDCGLDSITGVPETLEKVIAENNFLTSFSSLDTQNIREIYLANNRISFYTDIARAKIVDLSYNSLTTFTTKSTMLEKIDVSHNSITSVRVDSRSLKELNLAGNQLYYEQNFLETTSNINAPALEVLNISDNWLGIYKGKVWPEAGNAHGANSTNYWESESTNKNQPLQTITINIFPNLREINLQNNHIRTGLNTYDKNAPFQIISENLQKVYLEGNNIGNSYRFENSDGAITKVDSTGAYNAYGMTISYDGSGCFYTGRTYWSSGILWWKKSGYDYWNSTAKMY